MCMVSSCIVTAPVARITGNGLSVLQSELFYDICTMQQYLSLCFSISFPPSFSLHFVSMLVVLSLVYYEGLTPT